MLFTLIIIIIISSSTISVSRGSVLHSTPLHCITYSQPRLNYVLQGFGDSKQAFWGTSSEDDGKRGKGVRWGDTSFFLKLRRMAALSVRY